MKLTIRLSLALLAVAIIAGCATKDEFVCGGTGKTCFPVEKR